MADRGPLIAPQCLMTPALLLCAGVALLQPAPGVADDVPSLCQSALAFKRAGQLARAAAVFEQAIRLDPGSVEAHWGLAWTFAAQGRREPAIREFRRVVELAAEGEHAAEAAAALRRLGAMPREPEPRTPHPPPTESVPPSLAAARALLGDEHVFAAVRVLRAVLADDPDNREAQALLGQVKGRRRTVYVRAAAGPTFRSVDGWQERLRARFEAAARHIGRQVELDLVLLSVEPWDYNGSTADGIQLIARLQEDIAPDGADIVIAFIAEEREAEKIGERMEVRGHTLGLAPCFTGCAAVSEVIATRDGRQWRVPEPKLQENLVHEIGHLFGAVHVNEESVMRPSPGARVLYQFDPLNLEIVRTCRWIDFDENLASLSADELARMADLYGRVAAGPGADDGVHFYRAEVLSTPLLARYQEAIDEYEQVLATSSQDPFAHFNIAELYNHIGHIEQARAHWKIAAFIGKPAVVAALAEAALDRTAPQAEE